ncbi:MAG: Fe2+-dependent dioxygenase [Salinisphaera sp.]|nr:Fe2+-dependent dioxygenase [Salinisphaera sp.]
MLAGLTGLLGAAELAQIRGLLDKATYVQGKTTAGYRAGRVKANLQLRKDAPETNELGRLVIEALQRSKSFNELALPYKVARPLFSRYLPGMEYGFHVDSAVMKKPEPLRTDISVTVFLNDPADYQGGELVIQNPYGEQRAKLNAGDAVLYPTSALHRVAPVTEGQRLVAVTWLQSYIRDPARREILADLNRITRALHHHAPDDVGADLAGKVHSNLYRMWCEV